MPRILGYSVPVDQMQTYAFHDTWFSKKLSASPWGTTVHNHNPLAPVTLEQLAWTEQELFLSPSLMKKIPSSFASLWSLRRDKKSILNVFVGELSLTFCLQQQAIYTRPHYSLPCNDFVVSLSGRNNQSPIGSCRELVFKLVFGFFWMGKKIRGRKNNFFS